MTMEQGAEESNLESMKHRVCQKNDVVLYRRNILSCSGQHFNTDIHQLYTSRRILIFGANSQISREQRDTKMDLGSMKSNFGEHQENNSGFREKGSNFKGSRELGTLPYGISYPYVREELPHQVLLHVKKPE